MLTVDGAGVGAGTVNIFVNGVATDSLPSQLVQQQDASPRVGIVGNGWQNSSEGFFAAPLKGSMNNLRFYARAMTASEIQQLYLFESTPKIISQPSPQVGYWGLGASFQVYATSPFAMHYQWFKDGFAISWATNAVLSLSNLDFTDAGQYSVVVSNTSGSTASAPVGLLVNPAGVTLGFFPFLTITGAVGKTFGIQYSTNLNTSSNWTTLTSITLAQPVQFWVDTNADATVPGNLRRFYRVVAVP